MLKKIQISVHYQGDRCLKIQEYSWIFVNSKLRNMPITMAYIR